MKRIIKAVIICSILIAGFWMFYGKDKLERYRFYRPDATLWQNSKPRDRYYIGKFFVDHNSLIGLSHQQVLEMLGPPTKDRDFEVYYYLGAQRGLFPIDGILLDIYFKNDKVTEVKMRAT